VELGSNTTVKDCIFANSSGRPSIYVGSNSMINLHRVSILSSQSSDISGGCVRRI
jgi:hypothetical protein